MFSMSLPQSLFGALLGIEKSNQLFLYSPNGELVRWNQI
jgi:hypothetical protein